MGLKVHLQFEGNGKVLPLCERIDWKYLSMEVEDVTCTYCLREIERRKKK